MNNTESDDRATGKLRPRVVTVAAGLLVALALAGCTAEPSPQAAEPTPTPTATATPIPNYLTELPAWAREGNALWLVYPEGFKCWGTEGCGNDYRAFFGEPGPVLPEGVEYYDPAKHGWVKPADEQ